VSLNIPYYKPDVELLKKVNNSEIEWNMIRLENFKDLREDEIIELLKKYSKIWIGRNYPTSNKASWYGSAIITDKWNLYFAGQYSTPDHRYGVHSEPAVFISALSNNDKNIVYLWVSSTKHQDVMCEMCGCCRQFYAEIIERTKQDIKFFTFSFDWKSVNHYDWINEYLKNTWSSKNNS
jgi:cytidine deaminase